MNCIYCGKELRPGALFCMYCGKKIEPVEESIEVEEPIEVEESVVQEATVEVAPAAEADVLSPVVEIPEASVEETVEAEPSIEEAAVEETIEEESMEVIPAEEMDVAEEAAVVPVPVEAAELAPTGESALSDESTETEAPTVEEKPKKSKKKLIIIAGVLVALAIAAAVMIPIIIRNGKQARYDEGITMLESGDYQGAYDIFTGLEDFEDSADQAAIAENGVKYTDAVALMEDGKYDEALDLFDEVEEDSFPDLDECKRECRMMPTYLKAQEAFAAGNMYDAYRDFNSLGNFKDAKEKAKSCLTPLPKTGETYRNSAYKGNACDLTVKAPLGRNVYFKIYAKDGKTLVSSSFINKGGSIKLQLAAGTYIFKAAYGSDQWFGEKEMFGNVGSYEKLKADGKSNLFTLKNNYTYTLTLRTTGKTAGNTVTSDTETPDTF